MPSQWDSEQWTGDARSRIEGSSAGPLQARVRREQRLVSMTFLVYDGQDEPAREFALRNAHLLEADAVVTPGAIAVEGGLLRCEPSSAEAAALALQWSVRGLGRLTLRTCLLPQRQAPYLLSLELARHAIMLFLVKLEDWGLHELPADDPAMEAFERARGVFIEALCAQPTPAEGLSAPTDPFAHATAEQDRLAREALALAVEAGERLALARADEDLGRRLARAAAPVSNAGEGEERKEEARPLGRPTIGCAIIGDRFSGPLRSVVEESFDFINIPMRWVDLEPVEGRYDFSKADRWIEWAVRTAKMPVVGGPLIDLGRGACPDWLHIWENDYETLRELVFEHVKKVATRYRKAVRVWTITSSLQVAEAFHLSIEEALDLTRTCALVVRKVQKNARIQVEIAQPFGEYGSTRSARTLPPHHYAELLCQAGVPVDVFGVRVQVGDPSPGRSTRDLATLSDLLDRLAVFEKPVAVTALGAPARAIAPTREDIAAGRDGGEWRGGWSETTQADWMTRMLLVALAKPFLTSVCWQDLYDRDAEGLMRFGGLISGDGQPRQALKRMTEIHRRLTRPISAAAVSAGVEELATAAPPSEAEPAG